MSELPQKQGGLDMTIPAHQSTQNKLCIVPKDINKRFFNFHTSLCNSSSSLHTCIWKCSLLKYNAPILGGPAGNLGRPLTTSELANTLKPITLGKAPGLTVSRLIFFFFPINLQAATYFSQQVSGGVFCPLHCKGGFDFNCFPSWAGITTQA